MAITLPTVGYFHPTLITQLQVCGSAAEHWFRTHPDPAAQTAMLQTHAGTTLLLAADAAACPQFRQFITRHFDGAILVSSLGESRLAASLRVWASLQPQPQIVHGVLMQVHGLGLLVTGASGAGKSDLALELLSRGHQLVADDAIEVRRIGHGCLIGRSPTLLAGFIEARGLGILDARALYGKAMVANCARLDLALHLQDRDSITTIVTTESRLRGTRCTRNLLGETLPMISLSPRLGHNLAIVAEAGCRDHWLRLSGYHADEQFIERQRSKIDGADASRPNY